MLPAGALEARILSSAEQQPNRAIPRWP